MQTPPVHLIKDSLSLKSTFKSRVFNKLLLAVSIDSFVQKEHVVLAHSRARRHQTSVPPQDFEASSAFFSS